MGATSSRNKAVPASANVTILSTVDKSNHAKENNVGDVNDAEIANIVAGGVEKTRVYKDISEKTVDEMTPTELKKFNKFIRSNKRHQYADVLLGGTVYLLSGLQLFHGQHISALNIVTMWVSGTAFWVNYGKRELIARSLLHPEQTDQNTKITNTSIESTDKNNEKAELNITDKNLVNNKSSEAEKSIFTNLTSYPLFLESTLKPKCVFQYECTASWLWFMSAFQTFHQIKLIRYTGYSAWLSFVAVSYYSTRQLRCWLSE